MSLWTWFRYKGEFILDFKFKLILMLRRICVTKDLLADQVAI